MPYWSRWKTSLFLSQINTPQVFGGMHMERQVTKVKICPDITRHESQSWFTPGCHISNNTPLVSHIEFTDKDHTQSLIVWMHVLFTTLVLTHILYLCGGRELCKQCPLFVFIKYHFTRGMHHGPSHYCGTSSMSDSLFGFSLHLLHLFSQGFVLFCHCCELALIKL